MVDKNNLNRIKGILSAKKGAEIPKFLNPAGPIDYEYLDLLQSNPAIQNILNSAKLKDVSKNTPIISNNSTISITNPEFLKWCANLGLRPSPDNLSKFQEIKINNPNANFQQLITLGNTTEESPMKIPGSELTGPYAAVEHAADLNKSIEAKIEERKANAITSGSLEAPPIHGITVPKPMSLNTDISQLLQKVQTKMEQEAESYHMNLLKQTAKKEMWSNIGTQTAGTAVAAFEGIGNAIGAKQIATNSATTNMANSLYDTTAAAVEKMGPWGKIAGTAMKFADTAGMAIRELGHATGERMDTDQMTNTDKWMDSSFFSWNIGLINGAFGKNTQDFGIDQSTLSQVGSSYGGTVSDFNEANEIANKRYGLFSNKKRREADNKIATAKLQQNVMANIADTATDQRNYVQSMGEQAGLAYSIMTDGGYNQKYTYAAKQGGLLEWTPTLEIEWEPQIEINWELPTFKEGGNIDIVEELEWVPNSKNEKFLSFEEWFKSIPEKYRASGYDYKKAYEVLDLEVLYKHTKDPKNNHLQSASPVADENGNYPFLKLGKLEENPELQGEFDWYNSEDGEEHRSKFDIQFIDDRYYYVPKKFKKGGSVGDSDIPEIEETSQKNVIPEGALHKNKHHMEHAEGLTKKGIPVIDDNGEQQAEIEHSEIIFTLEVTKKLEEYYKIFYSDESSNKEKEQAALDAGKLLVYQILENTEDRTGLIESCKKGGTLTIKESEVVEDLLDWIPTIMIVEEIKEETKEERPKKKFEKSELEKDDLKELVKDVIREALIELLIK